MLFVKIFKRKLSLKIHDVELTKHSCFQSTTNYNIMLVVFQVSY